jgi:DNA-binding HxlR family transcriptional regulator
MENGKTFEADRQRAEVFDALGHPIRILILKTLSDGPMGFADLKKKTVIDSSGHLQHHLNKLDGLIKNDDYGRYCLSDQGRDALLTVQTVEQNTPLTSRGSKHRFNTKMMLIAVSILLTTLLITASVAAVIEHNKAELLQQPNAAQPHFKIIGVTLSSPISAQLSNPYIHLVAAGCNSRNQTGQIFFVEVHSLNRQTNRTLGGNDVIALMGPIMANMTGDAYSSGFLLEHNNGLYAKSNP